MDGTKVRALEKSISSGLQQRLLSILIASTFVGLALSVWAFYSVLNPARQLYFSTSTNGNTQLLTALSMPNQSDKSIIDWANKAAIAAYNYNFFNASESLQDIKKYFTDAGWDQFIRALENSNILKEVEAKRIIVSAVATNTPVILEKGPLNGRYTWRVQVPILITFSASGSAPTAPIYPVTMLINRISTLDSPQGIGISEFIVGKNILE